MLIPSRLSVYGAARAESVERGRSGGKGLDETAILQYYMNVRFPKY